MQSMGFVKLYRSLLDWEWYSDTNAVRLLVHVLLRVNYKDKAWKNGCLIRRGSMITSVQTLSKETGLSVQQTRTALRKLQESNQISIRTTNKYTEITVVDYDVYQSGHSSSDKQNNVQSGKQSSKQTTNSATTREEDKEQKEDKKIRKNTLLSAPADAKPREKIEYKTIADMFNRICVSLPQVQSLGDKRKHAIRAVDKTVLDFGGWEKLFRTVEQSDFLTGRNSSWNGCGFDWILKPQNLVKIMEGNYADKPKRKAETTYDGIYFGTTL